MVTFSFGRKTLQFKTGQTVNSQENKKWTKSKNKGNIKRISSTTVAIWPQYKAENFFGWNVSSSCSRYSLHNINILYRVITHGCLNWKTKEGVCVCFQANIEFKAGGVIVYDTFLNGECCHVNGWTRNGFKCPQWESWAAQRYKHRSDRVFVFQSVRVTVNIGYIVIIAESHVLWKKGVSLLINLLGVQLGQNTSVLLFNTECHR